MALVVNAVLLGITARLSGNLDISGVGSAVLCAAVISVRDDTARADAPARRRVDQLDESIVGRKLSSSWDEAEGPATRCHGITLVFDRFVDEGVVPVAKLGRTMTTDRAYEVRVRGLVAPAALAGLGDVEVATQELRTVLTGSFVDQAALYGLLNRLRALGLEVVEVRQVVGPPVAEPEVDQPGPTGTPSPEA